MRAWVLAVFAIGTVASACRSAGLVATRRDRRRRGGAGRRRGRRHLRRQRGRGRRARRRWFRPWQRPAHAHSRRAVRIGGRLRQRFLRRRRLLRKRVHGRVLRDATAGERLGICVSRPAGDRPRTPTFARRHRRRPAAGTARATGRGPVAAGPSTPSVCRANARATRSSACTVRRRRSLQAGAGVHLRAVHVRSGHRRVPHRLRDGRRVSWQLLRNVGELSPQQRRSLHSATSNAPPPSARTACAARPPAPTRACPATSPAGRAPAHPAWPGVRAETRAATEARRERTTFLRGAPSAQPRCVQPAGAAISWRR